MTHVKTFQTPLIELLPDVAFSHDFASAIGLDQVRVQGYRRADIVGLADRIHQDGVVDAVGGLDELSVALSEITQGAYWSFDVVLAPEAVLEIGSEQLGLGDDGLAIIIRELGHVDFMLTAPRSFIRMSTGKLSLRLPSEFLKPVEKGFAVTSDTIRRLRRTDLPQEMVDNLLTLLDTSYDSEADVREAIDTALGDDFPEPDRPYARLMNHFIDWVEQEGAREIEIDFEIELYIDTFFNVQFRFPLLQQAITPKVSLAPVMLGDTGFVIEADDIQFRFAGENRGLFFDKAALYLPKELPAAPDLSITHCSITEQGFSGRVAATWDLVVNRDQQGDPVLEGELAGELFGLQGGLGSVAVEFRESMPISSDIHGKLVIPYFEESEAIDVRLDLQINGDFLLQLRAADEDGVQLRKEELLLLQMKSLSVAKRQNYGEVVLSGGVEPLLLASDGLSWPRLDVEELTITKNLVDIDELPTFKFKEAWVDLKELATLDLFGFHFELNRVGLGYIEAEDKLWIDLTGNIRLIDQIPIGVGVEGFRITWPRNLYEQLEIEQPSDIDFNTIIEIASRIEVRFDGVYLFYGVPQAIEFEGYIRFIKEAQKVGFAGDMILRVPTSGLEIEAGLMIGINFEDPPYPFLYVYFGILLPTGIPLGQSGLALKGAKGMFGLNVTPDKTPEQNWYFDWYKRGPIEGAHPTNKWTDYRYALALGAGITITTSDGKILGVQGLLVIAIPGPFLMIEGKALIFDGLLPIEPPLKALAIFDGRELTAQINIEAGAELIEDILEASGVFEAFFDFRNLTNWHLYLGQDQPADRRVNALVLKLLGSFLFKAEAYLMVDMPNANTVSSRLGVFISASPAIPPLGPVTVRVQAELQGLAQVSIPPLSADAQITLDVDLEVSAFGFGLMARALGSAMAAAPSPFEVSASFAASVELPLPLQEAEDIPIVGSVLQFIEDTAGLPPAQLIEIDVEWSWSYQPTELTLNSPVNRDALSLDSPLTQQAVQLAVAPPELSDLASRNHARQSPRVEMDYRPNIMFHNKMNVDPDMVSPIAGHPDGTVSRFFQSIVRFKPTLQRIQLHAHAKTENWETGWQEVASSDVALGQNGELPSSNLLPLFGVWRADPDTESPRPSRRILRLWSHNPFPPGIGQGYYQTLFGQTNQVAGTLHAHPSLFFEQHDEVEERCLNFAELVPEKIEKFPVSLSNPVMLSGVRFKTDGRLGLSQHDDAVCLTSDASLIISLPVRVVELTLVGCKEHPRDLVCFQIDYKVKVDRHPKRLPEVKEHVQIIGNKVIDESTQSITIRVEEGFDRILIRDKTSCLCKLCYVSEEAFEKKSAASSQLAKTDELLTNDYVGLDTLFMPGHYYRLSVETQVEVEIDANAIAFEPGTFLHDQAVLVGNRILQAYFQSDSDPLTRSFTDTTYFQTDGPPAALDRYIKWVAPALGQEPVYCDSDLSIRFRRSYIKQMYELETQQLEFSVWTADGLKLTGWQQQWQKSDSATHLADEQHWLAHLEQNSDYANIGTLLGLDDVLTLGRCIPSTLNFKAGSDGWEVHDLQPRRASHWVIESRSITLPRLLDRATPPKLAQRQPTQTITVAKDTESAHFTYQAALETGVSRPLGVVFLFVDTSHYWLFELDPKNKQQRLVQVNRGVRDVVLEKDSVTELNRTYRVLIVSSLTEEAESSIEVKLDHLPWGQHTVPTEHLNAGTVGLFVNDNSKARFSDLSLSRCPALEPKSRYELVISGGSGGAQLLADSHIPAVMEQLAGAPGNNGPGSWLPSTDTTTNSGSGWTIDATQKRLSSRGNNPGELLFVNKGWVDVATQARIEGLTVGKSAGFILRRAPTGQALRITIERTLSAGYLVSLTRISVNNSDQHQLASEPLQESQLLGADIILHASVLDNVVTVDLNGNRLIDFDLSGQPLADIRSLGDTTGLYANQSGIRFYEVSMRSPVLARYAFQTSAFRSFTDLVDSGKNYIRTKAISAAVPTAETAALTSSQNTFASAQWQLDIAVVDLRDGEIDREAYEEKKLAAREAQVDLDVSFEKFDQKLAQLVHQPLPSHVDTYLLWHADSLVAIHLRCAESLSPQLSVAPSRGIHAYQQIGRTEIKLLSGANADPISSLMLSNAAGNQIVLLPQAGSSFAAQNIKLQFVYKHDRGDATADINHRYDRPVTSILGQSTDELVELVLIPANKQSQN